MNIDDYAAYHAAVHSSYVEYFAKLVESLIDDAEERRAMLATRAPQVLGPDYELERLRHCNVVSSYNNGVRKAASSIRATLDHSRKIPAENTDTTP